MKKIILLLLLCLPLLIGQQPIYDNVVEIAWDAVAPATGTKISYEVFYAPLADQSAPTLVGSTAGLGYTISITDFGDWTVGVRTVQTVIATGAVQVSAINWSHENGLATPNPFFLRRNPPFPDPAAPVNLRRL